MSSTSGHSGSSQHHHAGAHTSAAAAAPHGRCGTNSTCSGAAPLQQVLAAASAHPWAPQPLEWRVVEGRGTMEVAMVLGSHVFVGRLSSRGPLSNWLPPAGVQQLQNGGGGCAAAPAAAAAGAQRTPPPPPWPAHAGVQVVKQVGGRSVLGQQEGAGHHGCLCTQSL
jgi:hypothetical protein